MKLLKKITQMTSKRGPLRAPNVYIRIRPKLEVSDHDLDKGEVAKKLAGWSEQTVMLSDTHDRINFNFPERVFGPNDTQQSVYDTVLPKLISQFTQDSSPYNILLFAYGQTGTGKTHTIFGTDQSVRQQHQTSSEWGVFPRLVDDLLKLIASDSKQENSYLLTASAIEFYLFGCFDLLGHDGSVPCEIDKETNTPAGNGYIIIRTLEDIHTFFEKVTANRTTRGTRMNSQSSGHSGSSRSHCALILTLRRWHRPTNQYVKTTFSVVDLAGAERPSSTGEERVSAFEVWMQLMKGKTVSTGAQGCIINYELSAIRTAVHMATNAHRRGRPYNPPTQLSTAGVNFLGSCMNGKALLSMIVCLSQARHCGWETSFSLNYGQDLSKLKCPVRPERLRGMDMMLAKAKQNALSAKKALDRTPEKGSPKSKYYGIRRALSITTADDVELLEQLLQQSD